MTRQNAVAPAKGPLSRRLVAAKLPKTGTTVQLSADGPALAALADHLSASRMESFSAEVTLRPAAMGRYVAEGEVSARLWRTCVVTLEDFPADVSVPIEAVFADEERLPAATRAEVERTLDDEDPPEPLDDGAVDVGALAVEFLSLALEPFPRKPGAELPMSEEPPARENPFAALAALAPGPRDRT